MRYVITALVMLVPILAAAEWSVDPQENNPVCTDYAEQGQAISVSDGAGGLIVVWEDERTGTTFLYAQRMDATGNPVWATNGIRVCTYSSIQTEAAVLSDGYGGVFVVWSDDDSGSVNLYGQRIDPDGTLLWPPSGQVICAATGSQYNPKISPDDTGGLLLIWEDSRGSDLDIYMQRADLSGALLWTTTGVAVCTEPENQYAEGVTYDTGGGGIAVWADLRDVIPRVYVRRVNYLGTPIWTADGNRVSTENTDSQLFPRIASNENGGAFITWAREDPGDPTDSHVCVQHINAAGARLWGDAGRYVHIGVGIYNSFPDIVADGEGGAFLVWSVSYGGGEYNVAGQHYRDDGMAMWGADGITLCAENGSREFVYVTTDGSGGMIATWADYRYSSFHSLYAQRIDALGTRLWGDNGAAVNAGSLDYWFLTPVADGDGGLVIAWDDDRTTQTNIYAQKMHATGYLGDPQPVITAVTDVPNDQGGEVLVAWNSGYLDAWPHRAVEAYSVWMREAVNKAGARSGAKAGEKPITKTSPQSVANTGAEANLQNGERSAAGDQPDLAVIAEKLNLPESAFEALVQTGWVYVDLVPATLSEDYASFAPTLADSSVNGISLHEFKVIAHGGDPWPFWESNIGTGYSVDNLAPSPPVNLEGEFTQPGEVGLTWEASGHHDEDLAYYAVYRGQNAGFPLDENHQVGTSVDLTYVDPAGSGVWFYRVTAVDVHENEGDGSNEVEVTDATDVAADLPGRFAFHGNHPNPFNPRTEIGFDLAGERLVKLKVFTVEGRCLRTLVDQVMPRGSHNVIWDGRDAAGRRLASGVYWCRLEAGDFVATHKMVMVK